MGKDTFIFKFSFNWFIFASLICIGISTFPFVSPYWVSAPLYEKYACWGVTFGMGVVLGLIAVIGKVKSVER